MNDQPTAHAMITVDRTWSDDHGMGVQGWVIHPSTRIIELRVATAHGTVPVTSWHQRPDVVAAYPSIATDPLCGFWAYVERSAQHEVSFQICTEAGIEHRTVLAAGSTPPRPDYVDCGGLFDEFIRTVNSQHLNVLEIGSRLVSPGSSSKRPMFRGASSYVGFDYHSDANTDVTGDAHQLSTYFSPQQFDAIFSVSVLEHIAMPWAMSLEINKLLRPGGLTFHATHFAWPLHDGPWDFWRFSDEGLKVLFSRPMGYEVVKAGYFSPLRLHLDAVAAGQEGFSYHHGFGGSAILAKKVAGFDDTRLRWEVPLKDVIGADSHYPKDPD